MRVLADLVSCLLFAGLLITRERFYPSREGEASTRI